MAMNALKPTMQFVKPLLTLGKMLISIWDKNNYMRFLQPHSTPLIDKMTLCLLKNGIWTLANIVIADPTRSNLLLQSCATQGFSAFDATQAKESSYHN
jgi:hypothetical protein